MLFDSFVIRFSHRHSHHFIHDRVAPVLIECSPNGLDPDPLFLMCYFDDHDHGIIYHPVHFPKQRLNRAFRDIPVDFPVGQILWTKTSRKRLRCRLSKDAGHPFNVRIRYSKSD
jgi:hypothetical protein